MLNLQTIVISLVRSPERREKARAELSKTSLKWEFLDAVDGSRLPSPPPEYNAPKVRRLLGFDMTANEIGCFLSHKKAWQACVENRMPTLIFEDDFVLQPHFEEALHVLVHEFHDWQMVRLQALAPSAHRLVRQVNALSIVENNDDPLGATAYVVKPQAAETLIQHAKDIYEPLDHFIEHKKKHGISMLAVKPYPVDISRVQSTISDRPDARKPIKGLSKNMRSASRLLDRIFSKDPWFPR